MRRAIIGFILLFSLQTVTATTDVYPLTPEKQTQFQSLLHQFRCLVCQNQDLADSNADLAGDLRGIIYDRVQRGQTDDEIKRYLTERYGEFVLYQPSFNRVTSLLWLTPVILFLLAGIGFYYFVRQRQCSL